MRLSSQSATEQVRYASHGRKLNLPSFSKPVAHDSDHTGPTSGLQQAVHNPETAVEPLVVEMQPFCKCAKEEYLDRREKEKNQHRGETLRLLLKARQEWGAKKELTIERKVPHRGQARGRPGIV